jgi:hypothetical protein
MAFCAARPLYTVMIVVVRQNLDYYSYILRYRTRF